MNKPTFDAMLAQYEVKEASGAGEVSWENGVHCEIPEVVISGKAEQTWYEGRNLFNLEKRMERPLVNSGVSNDSIRDFDENSYFIGITCNNYYVPSNITNLEINYSPLSVAFNTASSGYGLGLPFKLTPGESYYIKLEGQNVIPAVSFYTEEGRFLNMDQNGNGIFVVPEEAFWTLVVVRNANEIGEVYAYNIQIEKGIVATSYEPYVGGIPAPNLWYPIEPVFSSNTKIKSRSKNVLDFMSVLGEGYTNTLDGVTVTIENGWAIFKGEHAIEKWSNVLNFYITPDLRPKFILPAGTYTTPKNIVPNATGLTLQLYDMATNTSLGNKSGTFTLEGDAYLTGFYAAFQTVMPVDCKVPLTVFRGDVAPMEYIPYFDGGEADVPELLSALHEYQDLWNPQTGIKEKVIEVLSFSGEENWYSYNNTSVALGHWAGNKDKQASYNEPIGYFCTHAIQSNKGNPDQNDYTFVTHCDKSSNNNWIVFHCNMSLQEWKEFLASEYSKGTPVTVWYVLAEPEIIQTTPQPLIQPKGSCEIIQTEGTVSGCPISAKYLAHK